MTGLTLAQRVQVIAGALSDVPHAFGGALALAYYAEPRATVDIDLNVFVPVSDFDLVVDRLSPLGIQVGDQEVRDLIARDGQARAFWDETPLDVFLAYDPFHDAARGARRTVPFADASIDVLSPEHLIVCKVVYNRSKDWVDIEAILATDTPVDAVEIFRWVARIASDDDRRYARIVGLLTR